MVTTFSLMMHSDTHLALVSFWHEQNLDAYGRRLERKERHTFSKTQPKTKKINGGILREGDGTRWKYFRRTQLLKSRLRAAASETTEGEAVRMERKGRVGWMVEILFRLPLPTPTTLLTNNHHHHRSWSNPGHGIPDTVVVKLLREKKGWH